MHVPIEIEVDEFNVLPGRLVVLKNTGVGELSADDSA